MRDKLQNISKSLPMAEKDISYESFVLLFFHVAMETAKIYKIY